MSYGCLLRFLNYHLSQVLTTREVPSHVIWKPAWIPKPLPVPKLTTRKSHSHVIRMSASIPEPPAALNSNYERSLLWLQNMNILTPASTTTSVHYIRISISFILRSCGSICLHSLHQQIFPVEFQFTHRHLHKFSTPANFPGPVPALVLIPISNYSYGIDLL